MHNAFKGIMVGLIGLALWVSFSIVEAFAELAEDPNLFGLGGMYLGFILMVGGPIIYIIVIPAVNRLRRRS